MTKGAEGTGKGCSRMDGSEETFQGLRICREVRPSRVTDMTDQEFALTTFWRTIDRKPASVWKLHSGGGGKKPGGRAWSELES